jgi:Leucine-rich repeat (LRR) protein
MKKLSYLLMAASLLLLIACPGEFSDPKKSILDKQLKSVLSSEMMKTIKEMGMPIHYGTNPPNIEGTYLADDQTLKMSNIRNDTPPGTKFMDEVLTISDQDNDKFTATLKLETESYSNTYSMVISGKDDKFTLYASTKIYFDDNTSINGVVLYSGRIEEGEIYDLHNGMFITDEEYFGMGEIYYEADGVAERIGGNTSGEPIVVTGETVTVNYKGKDLVMKFPSNLQISIKASKNKGAPKEEISITEAKEMEMFNLGKHVILDFSKTKSAYTVDVETVVDKGLNAEEDIDCSLFTTDRQSAVATNGRIYKKVDFKYDKETGKLTLSFKANEPFSPTKSGSGRYSHLAVTITPGYNFETESITMKAPYLEQVGSTCWAACAMMFIRSYRDLDPKQDNSLFRFVKDIGHTTLDQGWNTNFITFWSDDTGSIIDAIEEKIDGNVKISSSSFRRTKSAAIEMVKLLKKRHPVILNYGTHVLFVIGYKKGANAGATSFLVHDPQGVSGDMYKWIVWDDYLKKVNFNEAWFRGDAIYIIYADKPMLDNPILQTIAIPAADNENQMCPTGADLTFTMQAYGKSRKVFPKYDPKESTGIGWGKIGYDEKNVGNDTIYSPTQLKVAMRVYNADDKPVSMLLDMDLGGGAFKHYVAEFTPPANSFYTVKGDDFKDVSRKQFDPTLSDFFKVPGNKELRMEFALKNVWGDGSIEEFDYYGLVVKSDNYISLTTSKAVGATIELQIMYNVLSSGVWIDLNNNGKKEAGEEVKDYSSKKTYTLGAQTIRIYGPVTHLTCENNQLTAINLGGSTTLKGINCTKNQLTVLDASGCKSLEIISCFDSQLASINVTGCTALHTLACNDNRLTSLNVSGCTALQTFYCYNNQLTELNADGCTALKSVLCYNNKFISLKMKGLKALEYLWCYDNRLTSLDVSECTALKNLSCYNNKLTSLDMSGYKTLESLMCHENQLTSLNVSGCTALQTLNCYSNKLTSLDVSSCTALTSLHCGKNNICSVRPAVFDRIYDLSYDIRYEYRWDTGLKKYVVSKDHGKGYWYSHEPGGGCHQPYPCNN